MSPEEFIASIRDTAPPAPEQALVALEQALGALLPSDYRQFLLRTNGGYVGGRLRFRGGPPQQLEVGIHHIGGFQESTELSLLDARDCYEGRIPAELLWVMDDSFGNAICLAVSGPSAGAIYFWDHEEEPDSDAWNGRLDTAPNVVQLASSFTNFVAGIRHRDDLS
jgi:hypothetical protein